MKGRKIILLILWILLGIIAIATLFLYFTLPHWKGIYVAIMGGFLILNLLVIIFFVNRNFKN